MNEKYDQWIESFDSGAIVVLLIAGIFLAGFVIAVGVVCLPVLLEFVAADLGIKPITVLIIFILIIAR